MARGALIDGHYLRKTVKFGLTIVHLTPTYFIRAYSQKGFLLYDKIRVNKDGQLVGYWDSGTGKILRDNTGIYPKGTKVLRITNKYVIIK